ncbi:MAG: heparan-alpha-glucosaminide N-acetyltransferase domain-containing protein [Caulobacter sp.]
MASNQVGGRVVALDLLRGLAVAGMILVVSPGAWDQTYAPLRHADWHGWTPGDLVFPTFLFCVGMAVGLSVPRLTLAERAAPAFWLKAGRRIVLLILLGLLLNALPNFDLAHLRLPGVLQRIGLCYGLALAVCVLPAPLGEDGGLRVSIPAVAGAASALLALYWLLLAFVPVPGFGAGRLDSNGSLPAFVDRLVFTVPHLWRWGTTEGAGVTYDPEGLLSTLPATVNVLIGALSAAILTRGGARARIILVLLAAGLIGAGLLLDGVMPINKRIWTPSFALMSSGWSVAALVAVDLAVGARPVLGLAAPLRVFGGNAILAFVLSQLLGVFSGLPILPGGRTPQGAGYEIALRLIPDPKAASLACAVAVLALILAVLIPLHRRGIHLRL